MLIHDHVCDERPDSVRASALADHGDADEHEHRLPLLCAGAGDAHHAYAHARVPLLRVYRDDHGALLNAAIHRTP